MRRRKSERNPFAWKRILEQFWKNCMIGKIVRETLRYPKRYAKILDNILYKNMGHDMEALVWETAEELDKKLAERMRRIRRRRKVSQQKLSDMSGVSYGSIKRFETTGQISLLSLTKLAMALELADELRDLFTQVPYRNIQEVINESKGKS